MIRLEDLYFEWLLSCVSDEAVSEEVAKVSGLLHSCFFRRDVGRDINRAIDGANLRKEFFDLYAVAEFDEQEVAYILDKECSWLEMLVALCRHLDFLYEGGVLGQYLELLHNMGLDPSSKYSHQLRYVKTTTNNININRIDRDGRGGIFPLTTSHHSDQREVEIWEQHAAYFREKLEGVQWTSTS